jgi:hypothetical protein
MLCLLLQHCRTICFLIKVAWYGDVHFKQWAVTEFIVAEKESVTNIHKRLKIYTVLMLFIKALLVIGLQIAGSEKGQMEAVMGIVLAGQQELSLRHCFNVLMNSYKMTNRLQPGSL